MRMPDFTLSWMLRGVVDRQLHDVAAEQQTDQYRSDQERPIQAKSDLSVPADDLHADLSRGGVQIGKEFSYRVERRRSLRKQRCDQYPSWNASLAGDVVGIDVDQMQRRMAGWRSRQRRD